MRANETRSERKEEYVYIQTAISLFLFLLVPRSKFTRETSVLEKNPFLTSRRQSYISRIPQAGKKIYIYMKKNFIRKHTRDDFKLNKSSSRVRAAEIPRVLITLYIIAALPYLPLISAACE